MKKTLMIIMCIMTMFSATLFIASGCGSVKGTESLKYAMVGDGYTVTGLNSDDVTDLVIPAVYEGKPVTSIDTKAFYDYKKLTKISIPKSVTEIGKDAFYNCGELEKIVVEKNNPKYYSMENCLIEKDGEKVVMGCKNSTIPDGIKIIGSYAFSDCKQLREITIPDSVTILETGAFSGCNKITNITIPDSVTTIGAGAFRFCCALTDVKIGNGVTEIGTTAFVGCSKLENISVPDSIENVGMMAFYDCQSLKYNEYNNALYLGNETNPYVMLISTKDKNITTFTPHNDAIILIDDACRECHKLESITISMHIKSIGKDTFNFCEAISSIKVDKSNTYYYSKDNCIIEKQTEKLIMGCKNSIIPDGVKIIGEKSFKHITLSDELKWQTVIIPDSVLSIEKNAFSDFNGSNTIVVGKNVKSIGDEAFLRCGDISSIVIPKSLEIVGERVFNNEVSNIYYEGTESEWAELKNVSAYNNKVYFYSENKPAQEGRYWHYELDNKPARWC